jgi:catalase
MEVGKLTLDRDPENYFADVNRPHAAQTANYGRDGHMRFDGNGRASVNYGPNSLGSPVHTGEPFYRPLEIHGVVGV